MNRKPLTVKELREMGGQPVYCPEAEGYGIVVCETIGQWAGIPFLLGAWHHNGVATKFEWDIENRGLSCYRINLEEENHGDDR